MGYRVWRTHIGETAPLWYIVLIFTCSGVQYFIPQVLVHHINHYIQDLHYSIPSDWLFHYSPPVYMGSDG